MAASTTSKRCNALIRKSNPSCTGPPVYAKRCSKNRSADGIYCHIHQKDVNTYGKEGAALRYKRLLADTIVDSLERHHIFRENNDVSHILGPPYRPSAALRERHSAILNQIRLFREADFAGITYTQLYEQRDLANQLIKEAEDNRSLHAVRQAVALFQPPAAGAGLPLAAFAQDRQNVHRVETVEHVNKMLALLDPITVPTTQRTFAEIVSSCELAPQTILLLTQHYYNPQTIYGKPAIYPLTLDKVWAFICQHPEKEELVRRLKEELTENVGTCAQGNLTRLCNILSGYLDGMTVPNTLSDTMAEIAGRETLSTDEKIVAATKVLREKGVAPSEWGAWLEAF